MATTFPARDRPVAAAVSRPWVVAALCVVVLTGMVLAVVPRPLSPDVSGQLWIADRVRHGARLYVDISEINPPLWFWLAIPVDTLAEAVGLPPADILILAVGCAALAALLATNRLLGQYPPAMRSAFLLYGACILLVMPLRDLGQREQLALIAALPYVALIAARRQRRQIPTGLAVLVACGAAVGFAFKHYFVGVPLLLELWLVCCLRRDWRFFRPEPLVLLAGALSYGVAIVIVTPGYLHVSVPELMLAYGAAGAPSLRYMLRPAQPIWVLMMCGLAFTGALGLRRSSPLVTALLVAAAGFFLAWLVQHKGWPYQSIATTGMLALALAAAVIERALGGQARPRLIAVAALVAPLFLCAVPTQWVPTPDTDIASALVGLEAGDPVAIVSNEGRTAWPATVDRGLRFVGRHGSFWIFAAVDAAAAGTNDPRIAALGRKVVRETVLDYRCTPPTRIVFAPGKADRGVTTASDDPLGYFLRDPEFVRLLAHYRRMERSGDFDAFERMDRLAPLRSAYCPRGL